MTEKTVREQLDESVKDLFEKSEAELELELGRRLTQTEREIQAEGMLTTAELKPNFGDGLKDQAAAWA